MCKALSIIFFILLALHGVDAFGRRHDRHQSRKYKNEQKKVHVLYNPLTDPNVTCVDPHCSCGSVGFGIVQKIPYLPAASCWNPVEIRFSSACVRCGLCLAIAEELNQTLLDTHDMMKPNSWLNETEAEVLLNAVCEHSFRHYSLREIDDKRYICDRMPIAKLVTSSADGLWGNNLRDKCKIYLAEIGPVTLYKHWQKWSGLARSYPDLATILCRGHAGIFRDCNGIANIAKPEVKKRDYHAKVKFMVEFKCR